MEKVTKQDVWEVRHLRRPAQEVKQVLSSTCLLLGHSPQDVKSFDFIKMQLANETFPNRMKTFDLSTVPLDVALGALVLLGNLTQESVQNVCCAASRFMQWNETVIQAVLSRYGQEEIANTKPCTEP